MKSSDAWFDQQGQARCPCCRKRVSEVIATPDGREYRRHLERLDDGSLCPHGQGETD